MKNIGKEIGSKLNLSAAERGTGPDSEDREDAHQEGEDRREQEAPPSPLPETRLWGIFWKSQTISENLHFIIAIVV